MHLWSLQVQLLTRFCNGIPDSFVRLLSIWYIFKYGHSKKNASYRPWHALNQLEEFLFSHILTMWPQEKPAPWKQLTIQMAPAAQSPKKDIHGKDIFFSNWDIQNGLKGKENGQQSSDVPTYPVIHSSSIYWSPTTHKTFSVETVFH